MLTLKYICDILKMFKEIEHKILLKGVNEMAFNYNKLRGKIVEVFGTQDNFAKKLGISTNALSRKMNNKISLSQKEVIQWAELLGICEKDYKAYFFTVEVQND